MQQTPINDIHNVDVLGFMGKNYANVVEVGSSSGALAKAYHAINPACCYTGIEIDKDYAQASKKHCNRVILGNVETLSEAVFAKLDGAQCWVFADALEHLYDPWKLLARIKASAAPGVEIVACIPNAQHWGIQTCLNSGQFVYQNSGLLDRTHIRWLTRITILEMFRSSGYQVEQMIARVMHQPAPLVAQAIRSLASASGADPDTSLQDSIAFQYVVRAVAQR
jgi:hypothetical protein